MIAPSTMITNAGRDLTGYPVFQRPGGHAILVPYGRDPIRWIPEMSPLLLQAKVVLSKASITLGGPPITSRYHPYEGRARTVRLDDDHLSRYGFGSPYVWWAQGGMGKVGAAGVIFFLALGGGATALLVLAARRT